MTEPGASWKYLRDPENYDFRPKADSPLVNAGIKQPIMTFQVKILILMEYDTRVVPLTLEHTNMTGAIIGFQEDLKNASTPVPKNNAKDVPLNANLMFLKAYQTKKHEIWIGNDPKELKNQGNRPPK